MKSKNSNKEIEWINPVGGLGDTLMLSGVLKLVHQLNPNKKYNLIRRTKYLSILENHPSIEKIGFPPKNSKIITSAYWSFEKLGPGNQRAFQILARMFGLPTPIEEILYFPNYNHPKDEAFLSFIPWKRKNILIAPSSDSPRKCMHPFAWHILVEQLIANDYFVIQVGKINDIYIKGTYSLLGLTTPEQLINTIIPECDLIITVDNFIMHAAHLYHKPSIVLWGPTDSEVYGYPEQVHITAYKEHCPYKNACLGPEFSQNYAQPCPLNENHCMNKINIEYIYKNVQNLL